jgi:hypothetical protein
VFFVCALSLHGVTWAVIALLRDLLPPGPVSPGAGIAFQIAVIVIGLPVFVVHWLWAQRSAAGSKEERGSVVRRLYLYGTLAGLLGPALYSSFDLITSLLCEVFGIQNPRYSGYYWSWYGTPSVAEIIVNRLVALVILGLLWWYHQRVTSVDAKAVPERGPAAAIRRFYLFAFGAVGLGMATMAIVFLVQWILFLGDRPEVALTIECTRLLLGGAVWLTFWSWAQRLFHGPDEEERESVLRKVYLYLIVFVGVIGVITPVVFILRGLFLRLLDVSGGERDIRVAVATIIGMAVLWAYHAYVLWKDAAQAEGTPRQARIRRIYLYLLAAVGLGACLEGLAGDINVLIHSLAGTFFGTALQNQLAGATAVLIAGLFLWIVPWRQAQTGAAETGPTGAEERRAVTRSIYLYFYLFLATVTVLGSTVYIVYRLLSMLFGERIRGNLLIDLGRPVAFSLIAVGVWLYHGALLRRDRRLAERDRAERLTGLSVAVVDVGEGQLGSAVLDGLEEELPSIETKPIGLTQAAAAAMGAEISSATVASRLSGANLIVGPWVIAVPGGAGGTVSGEAAQAIAANPARKLLVPTEVEGWEWAGVERWKTEEIVQQTVRAVTQIAWGDEIRPTRRIGVGGVIAIIIGILFLLVMLVFPLLFYFVY